MTRGAEARVCDINYFIELKMFGFTVTPFNFFHYLVMDEARYLKYYFYHIHCIPAGLIPDYDHDSRVPTVHVLSCMHRPGALS